MALQVLAAGCSAYEITGQDENGNNIIVNHAFRRGDVLPDWVDEGQRFVLVSSGMAAEVGDSPDDTVRPFDNTPRPVVGDMSNFKVADSAGQSAGSGSEGSAEGGELEPLPADTAAKPVWEDYAVQKLPADLAIDRAQAESMTKAKLLSEVKQRYNDAADRDEQPAGGESLPPTFK